MGSEDIQEFPEGYRPRAVSRSEHIQEMPGAKAPEADGVPEGFKPYVPDSARMPEFTWQAVLLGAFLGIIFGASSLYLLLKVGMTVSASVPIAVLSITLFRFFSNSFGFRRATILENNVVQTAGSAGESIAFGVGVTMPALLLLGFEMDITRVMTVSVLGGVLGILMMIPLRKAFIVKQHGKLLYPEGTACAEVLVAGEKGGATANMVFLGFGIAGVHKFFTKAFKLWADEPSQHLYSVGADGAKSGLKGAEVAGELAPELLGVGYLIGPKIASLMMAGAVLSYWVLGPLIANIGENLQQPVPPAVSNIDAKTGKDKGLIGNMGPGALRANYLRYIGAGAVAAGGIISMLRAMPLILSSIGSGLRDLRGTRAGGRQAARTDRDLPMTVVLFGSLGLIVLLMLIPQMGLGIGVFGLLAAVLVLVFGFLFVTVSSRLTGEVGSSSNPISGMTIATLLLTCIIFFVVDHRDRPYMLTALSVAAVVCIASSNGGTTSQDLKTGFLVGATPRLQQLAITVGAITSALVIGLTMLALNSVRTHYTENVPHRTIEVPTSAPQERVGRPHEDDPNLYYIVHVTTEEHRDKYPDVKPGRYLVDAQGVIKYKTDIPIAQENKKMDNGNDAPEPFSAPQPELFKSIIEGILGGTLEWAVFMVGVLIAISLELAGVRALPFAVGMYISLSTTTPIFIGGMIRWITDRIRGVSGSEAETETTPGVLLSSGYIAGGTLVGLILAFFVFLGDRFNEVLGIGATLFGKEYAEGETDPSKIVAVIMFVFLAVFLGYIGTKKSPEAIGDSSAR
jgi:putative OPT family oligopeptide transporter